MRLEGRKKSWSGIRVRSTCRIQPQIGVPGGAQPKRGPEDLAGARLGEPIVDFYFGDDVPAP